MSFYTKNAVSPLNDVTSKLIKKQMTASVPAPAPAVPVPAPAVPELSSLEVTEGDSDCDSDEWDGR